MSPAVPKAAEESPRVDGELGETCLSCLDKDFRSRRFWAQRELLSKRPLCFLHLEPHPPVPPPDPARTSGTSAGASQGVLGQECRELELLQP